MNEQGRDITTRDILENIAQSAAHTHKTMALEQESRCPFCGYTEKEWKIDNFGWPECPKCGAT